MRRQLKTFERATTPLRNDVSAAWMIAFFCALTLALFAYAGSFSRLIRDDYTEIAVGKALGPWGSMAHWHSEGAGSFSFYFLHGLLAPLDWSAPAVAPAAILLLWLIALSWLAAQILSRLGPPRNAIPLALALSSLTLAAAAHGFHTLESLYWYSANTRYILPLAVFTFLAAAGFFVVSRVRSRPLLMLTAALGGFICFINAGLSETTLIIQFMALSLALALLLARCDSTLAQRSIPMICLCLVATAAGAIGVLTAQGVAFRVNEGLHFGWANPIRDPGMLAAGVVDQAFRSFGTREIFAGFMLAFAGGFFLALVQTPPPAPKLTASANSAAPAFALPLLLQLCLLPVLLSHQSDVPRLFGRYSVGYGAVIFAACLQIALFAALLWKRRQVSRVVFAQSRGALRFLLAALIAVFALFAMSQARTIHAKPATYLFLSALGILVALSWLLARGLDDCRALRLARMAWLASGFAALSSVPPVAIGLWVYGAVFLRSLSHVAFAQAIAGLFSGAAFGLLARRLCLAPGPKADWIFRLKAVALGLTLVILLAAAASKARLIPDFAVYAREWQARHQLLQNLSAAGKREAEVPPYSFDAATAINQHFMSGEGMIYAKAYYDLDSIVVRDAARQP